MKVISIPKLKAPQFDITRRCTCRKCKSVVELELDDLSEFPATSGFFINQRPTDFKITSIVKHFNLLEDSNICKDETGKLYIDVGPGGIERIDVSEEDVNRFSQELNDSLTPDLLAIKKKAEEIRLPYDLEYLGEDIYTWKCPVCKTTNDIDFGATYHFVVLNLGIRLPRNFQKILEKNVKIDNTIEPDVYYSKEYGKEKYYTQDIVLINYNIYKKEGSPESYEKFKEMESFLKSLKYIES